MVDKPIWFKRVDLQLRVKLNGTGKVTPGQSISHFILSTRNMQDTQDMVVVSQEVNGSLKKQIVLR